MKDKLKTLISDKRFKIALGFFIVLLLIAVGINEFSYRDKFEFISPIDYETKLIIRNDSYGKGDFGSRRNGGRRHNGLDILAPIDTEIRAVKYGRVLNAEYHKGLGNYVEIRHRGGLITIYGHLSSINVRRGQRLRQGDVIGSVGKTGNANYKRIKPHLHFEIRKEGIPQDPKNYIPYFKNLNR